MKLIPLFVILSIIFLAGCLGREVKVANDGIVINSFTASPDSVKEFNTVQFELEVENIGGATASNIEAALLDARGIWIGDTGTKTHASLKPPSIIQNTPGEFKIFSWVLTPPDLPEGVVVPFDMRSRVTYQYSSNTVVLIKVLTENARRIKEAQGEAVTDPIIIARDDFAPVKVDMSKGPVPLIIDPQDPDNTATFRIEIRNVGSGFPITDNKVGKIVGTIKVQGAGFTLQSCDSGLGSFGANGAILRDDGTSPILCTVVIDKSQWTSPTLSEGQITFTIELNYKYFVEESVTVDVQGVRGTGTGSTVPSGCIESNCNAFGAICCPGINSCVNWMTDENNCGSCGNQCSSGQTCVNGFCQGGSGGGQCIACGLWQNSDGSTRSEGLCCASPSSHCACVGPLTGCGVCEASCGADVACDGKEPGTSGCTNQCKFIGSTSAGPCYPKGDVNNDGSVNSVDSNLVLQHSSGQISLNSQFPGLSPSSTTRADVNGDGQVNSIDSNLILQYTGGQISDFPAC